MSNNRIKRAKFVQDEINRSKEGYTKTVKRLAGRLFLSEKTIERDAKRNLDNRGMKY